MSDFDGTEQRAFPFEGFAATNAHWIDVFERRHDVLALRGVLDTARRFAADHGAARWVPLPYPLIIAVDDYRRIVTVANRILDAQAAILRHLVDTTPRASLLKIFELPPSLEPHIDWSALRDGRNCIGRFDVLPESNHYWFCEHNSDSALGGSELYDCAAAYAGALDWPLLRGHHSPAEDVARFVRDLVRHRSIERVALCDWSTYRELGIFDFSLLQHTVQEALPDVDVRLVYNDDYPEDWLAAETAARTMVYRCFMHDDMDDDGAFYCRLAASGATIVNTFETEIRTSKKWFALYADERYRVLLTAAQLEAIDRFVPATFVLADRELADVLAEKNRYVFKLDRATSGEGVIAGWEISERELELRLVEQGMERWTVQQYVDSDVIRLRRHDASAPSDHRVVLGLYMIDGHASGLLIRGSDRSNVVNGSTGAMWCVPMSAQRRAELLAELAHSVSPDSEWQASTGAHSGPGARKNIVSTMG